MPTPLTAPTVTIQRTDGGASISLTWAAIDNANIYRGEVLSGPTGSWSTFIFTNQPSWQASISGNGFQLRLRAEPVSGSTEHENSEWTTFNVPDIGDSMAYTYGPDPPPVDDIPLPVPNPVRVTRVVSIDDLTEDLSTATLFVEIDNIPTEGLESITIVIANTNSDTVSGFATNNPRINHRVYSNGVAFDIADLEIVGPNQVTHVSFSPLSGYTAGAWLGMFPIPARATPPPEPPQPMINRDAEAAKIQLWANTGDRAEPSNRAQGWDATYSTVGGNMIERPVFNQLVRELTGQFTDWLRGGIPEWDSDIDYQHSAIVRYNGVLYVSTRSSTNEQPPGTAWQLY